LARFLQSWGGKNPLTSVFAVIVLAAAAPTGATPGQATALDWLLLWLCLALALGVSFLRSMLEASLLSLTPS
jgi:hypothetical protein